LLLERIQHYIKSIGAAPANPALKQQIFSLIDLTSLGDNSNPEMIAALCEKTAQADLHVAAVCIYPQFVAQAVTLLAGSSVKIATVANFPEGAADITPVLVSIAASIQAGANEIDVVFPYQKYLAGDCECAKDFVRQCKLACGENILLKVILETGALQDPVIIAAASRDVILAGADFIKTSTGKIQTGATLEAAAIMLLVINDMQVEISRTVGFKASGGVRTVEQAAQYLALANQILGLGWVSPKTFRFGASQLLDGLL
jgi:deoxyribose-phosphate aldolase